MPEAYVIERMDHHLPLGHVDRAELLAAIRTSDALTVISTAEKEGLPRWRCFRVDGPIEHHVCGILANISAILADHRIPIFAISEFDTDYVLVPEALAPAASAALDGAGHSIRNEPQ